jgi:uncharacterized protein YkwD
MNDDFEPVNSNGWCFGVSIRNAWLVACLIAAFFSLASLFSTVMPGRNSTDPYAMSLADFSRYSPAQKRISRDFVDLNLIEASIFHWTNRQRNLNHLPLFGHSSRLSQSARQHSQEMVRLQYISHTSPVESHRTLKDRLRLVGFPVNEVTIAENIAMQPAREFGSGKYQVQRDGNGREIIVDVEGNRVLDYCTYLELGEVTVRDWMKSPGHRANILQPALNYLGCGAARGSYEGNDSFYFTQNFASAIPAESH